MPLASFGAFLVQVPDILRKVEGGLPSNPKDHGAIILARGNGEPDSAIRDFMRKKFSCDEADVVLELSK
jgi:hypothetical protein